jgi:fumarylacetoacetate (FAA) hydrolase
MLEIIATGKPTTRFMQPGDWVQIEMFDQKNQSIFGHIKQQVVSYAHAL